MTTANYKKAHVEFKGRDELHELLGLTSCEISLNAMPEGTSVPFVHAHKQNEETYIVIEGEGEMFIDGDVVALKAGDVMRIGPKGARCLRATKGTLKILCVQAKENSLEGYTMNDGYPVEDKKPTWLK